MYSTNDCFVQELIIEIDHLNFPSEVNILSRIPQSISTMERQDINAALLICGFETREYHDFNC